MTTRVWAGADARVIDLPGDRLAEATVGYSVATNRDFGLLAEGALAAAGTVWPWKLVAGIAFAATRPPGASASAARPFATAGRRI